MIRVRDHKIMIEKMLTDYDIPKESLIIVPNIQEWCFKEGHEEKNPFRIAKCICKTDGTREIVFVEEISDDMISSSKGYMGYIGLSLEVSRLDTDYNFLFHSVLHEIACPVLETIDQYERDEWAFVQMEKYSI